MDFSGANRGAPVSGTPAVIRADVIATRNSVPVDLSPEKTVQSLKAGDAVRVDIQQKDQRTQDRATSDQQARQQASRDRLVIEPETKTVVLQRVDPQTGETVSQLPDETLLKLRIFSKQLAERALDRSGGARTDLAKTS
jgi:hypothetical protein